jgi:hypothetical protein
MEIASAFVGAVIGAIVSFVIAEYYNSRSERKKILTAVISEIELNIGIAGDILKVNDSIEFDAEDAKRWEWCEIIPMSDAAWVAVLSTGTISHLGQEAIEPLSRAFSLVRRANFAAEKIKSGKYQPREGKEYSAKVRQTREALKQALQVIQER